MSFLRSWGTGPDIVDCVLFRKTVGLRNSSFHKVLATQHVDLSYIPQTYVLKSQARWCALVISMLARQRQVDCSELVELPVWLSW